jgi:hypothetical protein
MLIAELDPSDLEFMTLARAGDFEGAHLSLKALATERPLDAASHAKWKAVLHEKEGDFIAAIDTISSIVSNDDLTGKFARHHRARIHINAGNLDDARVDLQTLLQDVTQRIVQALHDGCRMQLAYIFAIQGDPRFVALADEISTTAEYFIKDAVVRKSDLQALYRANAQKTTRRP